MSNIWDGFLPTQILVWKYFLAEGDWDEVKGRRLLKKPFDCGSRKWVKGWEGEWTRGHGQWLTEFFNGHPTHTGFIPPTTRCTCCLNHTHKHVLYIYIYIGHVLGLWMGWDSFFSCLGLGGFVENLYIFQRSAHFFLGLSLGTHFLSGAFRVRASFSFHGRVVSSARWNQSLWVKRDGGESAPESVFNHRSSYVTGMHNLAGSPHFKRSKC